MKPTPILEELKIAAEALEYLIDAEASDEHPDPIDDAIDTVRDDVIPNVYAAIKRHKKLCKVLREALAWCKQDATNEDGWATQTMLECRVQALEDALKLAKE